MGNLVSLGRNGTARHLFVPSMDIQLYDRRIDREQGARKQRGHRAVSADDGPRGQDEIVGVGGYVHIYQVYQDACAQDISLISERRDGNVLGWDNQPSDLSHLVFETTNSYASLHSKSSLW